MAPYTHIPDYQWNTYFEDNDEFINLLETDLPDEVLIERGENLFTELMPDLCNFLTSSSQNTSKINL